MAGAFSSVILGLHLSFAGNGFGQTGTADMASCESEQTKWNATCHPFRATGLEREVLLLDS